MSTWGQCGSKCEKLRIEQMSSAPLPMATDQRTLQMGGFVPGREFLPSFDHLVGGHEQGLRNREAEQLGGLEVDDKSVHRWLLKWQIARFLAAQNTVDVGSGLAKRCGSIRTVGDQSSGCRKQRNCIGDCGNAVACQKGRHLRAKRENGNVGRKKNTAIRLFCQACDGAFDVSKIVNGQIDRLNRKRPRNHFKRTQIGGPNGIVRIIHQADAGDARSKPLRIFFQHLSEDRELYERKSSHVAARPRETFHRAGRDRIAG